eukprot:TRINITY_DN67084_c0_g1_i2.p1 TRINITY_DN67084_c0_g1~~TRINITY_DN67084_c0_g1_i2.p1  ORF type:complete len:187 (+),score=18.56 TRINITY_DN67084_c0_g1_i2:511-1071(+)
MLRCGIKNIIDYEHFIAADGPTAECTIKPNYEAYVVRKMFFFRVAPPGNYATDLMQTLKYFQELERMIMAKLRSIEPSIRSSNRDLSPFGRVNELIDEYIDLRTRLGQRGPNEQAILNTKQNHKIKSDVNLSIMWKNKEEVERYVREHYRGAKESQLKDFEATLKVLIHEVEKKIGEGRVPDSFPF